MATIRSGRFTVTTSGQAEAGPETSTGTYAIRPLASNTGTVYLGMGTKEGDLDSSNGFELPAGSAPVEVRVYSLSDLKFDVETGGEGICWLKVR